MKGSSLLYFAETEREKEPRMKKKISKKEAALLTFEEKGVTSVGGVFLEAHKNIDRFLIIIMKKKKKNSFD